MPPSFPRAYGRYVLEDRIAMGGMAEIFRARTGTAGFDKRVCIKRVLPHLSEQPDFVTMFRDEAALAARLQHANVVQVFDFGEEEGTLYLAMEFIDGADLSRLMKIASKEGHRFSVGRALQIAIEMSRGLHHAHTLTNDDGEPLSIVHRDISPHNVLVSRAGEVKVTDFGIAKAAARATHTGTGVVKGKLAYMAPEQANSQPLDQRVDQFATGVVLWEMLTGARLFAGEDEVSVLRKVMTCEVPLPSELRDDLPEEVEALVMRALSAAPEDRFPDMRAFEHALSRCLFGVTDGPEQSDLQPFVKALLGSPENSRRETAKIDAPEPSATDDDDVPSLTAAGFSAIDAPRSSLGEALPSTSSPSDTIARALGDDASDPNERTSLADGSGENPTPATPTPQTDTGGTSATRTIVPGAIDDGGFLAVTEKVPSLEEEPDETERVNRRTGPPRPAPSPAPARGVVVAAAAAAAGLVVLLAVVIASRGGGEPAEVSDVEVGVKEVGVVVSPAPAAPAEPAATKVGVREVKPPNKAASPSTTTGAQEDSAKPITPETGDAQTRRESSAKEPASARDAPKARPRGDGTLWIEVAKGWGTASVGAHTCETPCKVELPTGSHLVRVKLSDGTSVERRARVRRDKKTRVRF